MFSLKNLCVSLSLGLALAACSGGGAPNATNNNSAVTASQPQSSTPEKVSTAQNPSELPGTIKEHGKGSRKTPNVAASTKEMLPFRFYNLAGYKVCTTGTSAKDSYKKTLFINLAAPSEECGSDPKKMYTLILPMSVVKSKNLIITPGMKVEKGVAITEKDRGNDRLVSFIETDIYNGSLKIQ
ncbi:hypothetical protein FBR05_04865 [Deltaproteobacteria bacterium PRO3]|nr:hypothetical protein [Deltaproteobacteria bacterium PRO3]